MAQQLRTQTTAPVRPRWSSFLAALIVVASLDASNAAETTIDRTTAQRLERIRSQYGIAVEFDYDATSFFPRSWLKAPISGKGAAIDISDLPRLTRLIQTFAERYPPEVLRENLKQIYLVADLQFYGKSFGATNSADAVYLRNGNAKGLYRDAFLVARLHSEFSSILMRKYQFPKAEWAQLNPDDFKYSGTGVEVLGQKDLYGQTPELLERGFLVRYSQSSMENDFNMISDWLFTRPAELAKLAAEHRQLAAKRQLAIDFYKQIDRGFTFGPRE